MRRLTLLLCGIALAIPSSGRAQSLPAALAVPESTAFGFATPWVVTAPSLGLQFVNLDGVPHNLVSVDVGPDSNPWCAENPYEPGECPLFRSDDLASHQTSEVFGISNLAPGQYAFACVYHYTMRGTLVVESDPGR